MTAEPAPLVRVRQWTAAALADLDEDHLEAVLLVSTELLTNAYEHGATPYGIRLRRSRMPCRVRVEVDDASPEQPVVGRSRLGETRGRGLVLVDQLSTAWGTNPLPGTGKTVWAEVSCERDGYTRCASRP
ncbi:ATP-binding protein [Saccharothrix sp. S26]|uniref:ATP-binding protein n=1 Tax=Saccharothrix sp. S26 TaxID=2907215 RepID=UPI001F30C692|nr:ATP-binding protein [Saccharothrix sp. S26]MCE6996368.1 ATP-binding protein [Saccharothrix sp. S26]